MKLKKVEVPKKRFLVVSVAYYKKQNGNTSLGWFGSGVELYRGQKLLASGPEAVKQYLLGLNTPLLIKWIFQGDQQ
jgi:hypothetical protein